MISIILPISRSDYLRPVFNCLKDLERPPDTELIIMLDGDKDLASKVDKRVESLMKDYSTIRIIPYGETPAEDIDSRRYRISDIHNKAKHYVSDNAQYVFLIEDDTVYPANSLSRMLDVFKVQDSVGFVEGVEVGRRKVHYIGAWHVDDVNDPMKIKSVMPGSKDIIQVIDAGGFYCSLTLADLYKAHVFEPYDKKGTNGLSCDVNYGLYISKKGYTCYLDWEIDCDHIGERGSVNLGNATPVSVVFQKIRGEWSSRVEV